MTFTKLESPRLHYSRVKYHWFTVTPWNWPRSQWNRPAMNTNATITTNDKECKFIKQRNTWDKLSGLARSACWGVNHTIYHKSLPQSCFLLWYFGAALWHTLYILVQVALKLIGTFARGLHVQCNGYFMHDLQFIGKLSLFLYFQVGGKMPVKKSLTPCLPVKPVPRFDTDFFIVWMYTWNVYHFYSCTKTELSLIIMGFYLTHNSYEHQSWNLSSLPWYTGPLILVLILY